jgi:solute carrier family 25 aspartate/glutamate transporter 12/13
MATITESVKDALVGSEDEAQLSSQTRADFMQHAVKDEKSGDYLMSEHEFINAIAPEGEDYVSIPILSLKQSF